LIKNDFLVYEFVLIYISVYHHLFLLFKKNLHITHSYITQYFITALDKLLSIVFISINGKT